MIIEKLTRPKLQNHQDTHSILDRTTARTRHDGRLVLQCWIGSSMGMLDVLARKHPASFTLVVGRLQKQGTKV